jgi:hypothetical protein
MKREIVLTLAILGLALVVIATVVRQHTQPWKQYHDDPQIRAVVPQLTGQRELCLTCHYGIEEISPSHSIELMGCVSCHGGVAEALDADLAHTGMIRNPADLAYVEQSCGGANCHSGSTEEHRDQIPRVQRSIQSTYTGAITLVLRAFNLQPDSTARYGIHAAQSYPGASSRAHVESIAAFQLDDSAPPLVQQFVTNCLSCHLQAEPIQQPYFYRATGCAACHVLYNNDGLYTGGDPTIPADEAGHPARHELTQAMPYTQCNHCHNRGNYELPTMSFVPRTDILGYLNTIEQREQEYYQPIAQFTRCEVELDCIDCHTPNEVMGDGLIYNNERETRYVQCQTCHGTLNSLPLTYTITDPNDFALRLLSQAAVGDTIVVTNEGEPMPHIIQQTDGQFLLTMKTTGTLYTIPLVMGSGCQQQIDQQESHYCHTCHEVNHP